MNNLLELSKIATTSAERISAICTETGESLTDLVNPTATKSLRSRELFDEVQKFRGVLGQMDAVVARPQDKLFEMSCAYYESESIRLVIEAKIADLIGDAKEGSTITALSKQTNIDSEKLGRILSYLATNHVFVKVSNDTFANNAISLHLKSGSPFVAYLSLILVENSKAAEQMLPALLKYGTSKSPDDTAFFLAHGVPFYKYLQDPSNGARMQNFNMAMKGTAELDMIESVCEDYDWKSLGKSVVVDVGGGVGTIPMMLAPRFQDLSFVVQDMPRVIEHATTIWKDIPFGSRTTFQAIDFMQEQPTKDANIYLLKEVLHNHPPANCAKILTVIKESMMPTSKLIVIDHMSNSPSHDKRPDWLQSQVAPAPLLPNYGTAMKGAHALDLAMMNLMNGLERSPQEFEQLLSESGFKMTSYKPLRSIKGMCIMEAKLA